ncbi:MAG: hypothetical protein R3293_12035 [Candidatus Promineifilaceae bacterium]|nr:hypothetical protein [Candidatus Promineifilaceae bacterium]
MYNLILIIHNLLRWLVLIFGVLAVIRAFYGWFGKKARAEIDDRLGLGFTVSLDIQLLLGLLLYFFFSPITRTAFQDFGAAMADADLRFFAVEHILMMVIAVVLVHIGRALSRRADSDAGKHKKAAIFFTLGLLVVLAAIPWSRALLPF